MAATSQTPNLVAVPQGIARRLQALVDRGEFSSFEQAAVAMIELGLLRHEQRTLPPAAGPPPPTMPRGMPPPGPPGGGMPPPRL